MKTILIVHQFKSFCTSLAFHLTPHCCVYTCQNGLDALNLLDQLRPDIFVFQLNLPHIDGLSVLRRSSYVPSVTIALTNIVNSKIKEVAADVGIQHLLLIPCKTKYIVDQIDQILAKLPSQS